MASLDEPNTWREWGTIDEEYARMSVGLPRRFPPVSLSDLAGLRRAWVTETTKDMKMLLDSADGRVSREEIAIPLQDGTQTRALVFKPFDRPTNGCPLLVLIHGGGFLFGSAEMEAPGCIRAAETLGCVAVSLDHRLAPEAKFPTAWEDCWDSLEWLASNASVLGADPSKGFILGGNSSGGQLVGTLSHWARDKNLSPPLTGLYFSATSIASPEILADKYSHLYHSRATGQDGLSQKSVDVFVESVQPDLDSELWSPLSWHNGHGGLPPTYFQVCGMDIQRDDSLIYERELRLEYGVRTRVDVYPGLPHVFWFFYPDHSAVKKFYDEQCKGFGWLLGKLD
ncbi:Alpha/Beta hydrolase protein [Xylariales sp. PMI_506]|nr:Alpha/Beta hydrolase protein [Xylariales sp. PMI_506]